MPGNHLSLSNQIKLLLLSVVLILLWWWGSQKMLTPEESATWDKVHAAQQHLISWKQTELGIPPSKDDLWNSGLIGVEWSSTTTTLGDLPAKRTSTHPSWAVQFRRWYEDSGLSSGDRIAIYSSGSFPGMLVNALIAAESMELQIQLIVSLGASSWGANHPDAPWPVFEHQLRRRGFIKKKTDFYTLGGGSEIGTTIYPEGKLILENAISNTNIPLLTAENLKEMVEKKTLILREFEPKLFINIGGSHANLGDDDNNLKLPFGLILPEQVSSAGNGVLGNALRLKIPAIHVLNMKALSQRHNIPFDEKPTKQSPSTDNTLWFWLGLIAFSVVLINHNRWKLISLDE